MLLSKLYSAAFPRITKLPQRMTLQLGSQSVRHGSNSKRVLRIYRTRAKEKRIGKWVLIYISLGLFPAIGVIFYSNVFLGNALLYDYDPDKYQPEYWEFYAHPISRFFAKYCMEDPKISYYKDIYAIEVDTHQARARTLIGEVEVLEHKLGRPIWLTQKDRIDHSRLLKDMEEYAEEHRIEETRKE